ncbi:ankyrin repeat domain-containing protein [Streptomyces tendae]|uniref:Ankyrin repeat domain-containing protein n=1 Tax=Streptomyces tendae TaxID=1932 RepID=A0ABX5ZSU5_STRTE|nr:ankyrin repeat domain-containing protein [Streptomyces tendae]QER86747.1 ankyrin repeat domain-containing protein [Streptomyces tendae]
MSGAELVAAVGRGDEQAVRRLLEAGTDPDTRTAEGLPVLCRAIAAYEADVAEALVEAGADQDRELPDGTTPLVRAVDGGSPTTVTAVLGREPRLRLPESVRAALLARARRWYEEGAEAVLRQRTDAPGPVNSTTVMDDAYHRVAELRLGGQTVRGGQGAILTDLEWAFRVLTPVDELVARAVAQGDPDHVDWSAAQWVLYQRRSKETWSAVAAHHTAPSATARRFTLDVLWLHLMNPWLSWRHTYEKETADLLVEWAARGEPDTAVLTELLRVLGETEHAGIPTVGLQYTRHPHPRVRAMTPDLLVLWGDGPAVLANRDARRALLELAGDEDPDVRARTGGALGAVLDGADTGMVDAVVTLLRDPTRETRAAVAEAVAARPVRAPAVADALYALLGTEDFRTRLNATYGLLRRDDPRTEKAVARLGTAPPGHEDDHRVSAIRHWQGERDRSSGVPGEPPAS